MDIFIILNYVSTRKILYNKFTFISIFTTRIVHPLFHSSYSNNVGSECIVGYILQPYQRMEVKLKMSLFTGEFSTITTFSSTYPKEIKLPDQAKAPHVELSLVTRAGWDAKTERKPIEELAHPAKYLVMAYNTGVRGCKTEDECKARVKELQQLHMDKGFPDLHYNFLIGQDGNIYEGRGWYKQPGQFDDRPALDEQSVCIGVLGDGRDPNYEQPLEFLTAIELADYGAEQGWLEEDFEVCEDTQKF